MHELKRAGKANPRSQSTICPQFMTMLKGVVRSCRFTIVFKQAEYKEFNNLSDKEINMVILNGLLNEGTVRKFLVTHDLRNKTLTTEGHEWIDILRECMAVYKQRQIRHLIKSMEAGCKT